MIKVRDLIAAEEALEAAEAEFRKLNNDTTEWSAYEYMDREGRKHLHVPASDFERREYAMSNVKAAHIYLLNVRQSFFEGV